MRSAAREGRIRDVRAGQYLDEEALLRVLEPARYRLLGETHDNPAHHAIRARLVDALGRSGLRPRVAFEQFDAAHDGSLQALLRTRKAITSEDVARAVEFDRKGWNWEFYRPIVEAALRHGMRLRAANLSRSEAMQVARRGATSAPPDRWTDEQQKALEAVIVDGHCGALPEKAIPGMVAAQRARDAKLAEALRDPPHDGVVLIAGNGHVRRDFGVPLYLGAPSVSVGLVEVGTGEARPRDRDLPFDYAWFTERTERPDPCEGFRKK